MSNSKEPARYLLLGIVLLCVMLAWFKLESLLAYTWAGVSQAEWWRWITAHFVHLDSPHLIINLTGLVLIFWGFDRIVPPITYISSGLSAILAIDLGLWWQQTGYYAGLSGMLHGLLANALFYLWVRPEPRLRVVAGLSILTLSGKLVFEGFGVHFSQHSFQAFTPAHTWGALGGAVSAALTYCQQKYSQNRNH